MTTLYLAGPISGLPNFNYDAFAAAAAELRAAGYTVLNPAENNDGDPHHPEGRPWYLRKAIKQLLKADAVALLPGWEKSAGAKMEVAIANELGVPARMWRSYVSNGGHTWPTDTVRVLVPSAMEVMLSVTDEFDAELLRIRSLHSGKRKDYTGGVGMLANYQHAGWAIGVDTRRAMFGRLAEKFFRIKSLLSTGEKPANESLEDSYRDIAIISILSILHGRGGAYADQPIGGK